MRDQFGHAANIGGHRRHAASHGFQRRQPEALQFARQQQHVGMWNDPFDVVLFTEKSDVRRQIEFLHQTLHRTALGAVAHQHQMRIGFTPHPFENAHAVGHSLHRPEIRKVNEHLCVRRNARNRRIAVAVRTVNVAVDEVGDDADLVFDAEHLHGSLFQIIADTSHAVGLLDGELGDGQIRTVRAHQRDVGAVQRGHKRQAPPRRHHLLCQKSGDGMRDGVVYVQQIQVLPLGHLRHARGQRQTVRRILKQRIGGDFHFVVVHARRPRVQAYGVGVADEVYVVTAVG